MGKNKLFNKKNITYSIILIAIASIITHTVISSDKMEVKLVSEEHTLTTHEITLTYENNLGDDVWFDVGTNITGYVVAPPTQVTIEELTTQTVQKPVFEEVCETPSKIVNGQWTKKQNCQTNIRYVEVEETTNTKLADIKSEKTPLANKPYERCERKNVSIAIPTGEKDEFNQTIFDYIKEEKTVCETLQPPTLNNLQQETKDYTSKVFFKEGEKKVFKITENDYDPGIYPIKRKHSFMDMSTRKHYPGKHYLSIIVNGEEKIKPRLN